MNLWCHRFSQNASQKFSRLLSYQTNSHSTYFGDFLVSVSSFLATILVCLVGQKSGKFLVGILGETNPKTVVFLQNLIHWPTSIDLILTTQSYNSLPSLLLCLASSTTRQPWLLCPFSSFIALICDNFEAAASGCCIAEGIAKCGSLTTTEHKWSIHQKTRSSSSSQLGCIVKFLWL